MASSVRSLLGTEWQPPTPPEARDYPYACWWVAAFSHEVGDDLLGRWLLDTPVLLYRAEDGRVVALENRCPHRGAPLTLGCRKGDAIQCGYHGFTFDASGDCIEVPSMKAPLAAARVRSFPVVEHAPYIWIYLGDPDVIGEVTPPHRLDWAEDAGFALIHGRMDVDANYMLLKENVLDLTHFGYVHAISFKITDWVDPPSFSSSGDTASYRQVFSRSPLPPVFAEPLGLPPGTVYDRENYGSFVSPALQIAAVDLKDPDTGAVTGRFRVSHATTPIDGGRVHEAEAFGIGREQAERMGAVSGLALMAELYPKMKKRGIRVLPGGDYGFPYNPVGRNARDLQLFVDLLGFTPVEALVAVTRHGGELMDLPVGQIRAGMLADVLLIDGDPTADVAILQDKARITAVMKDGRFHRAPPAHQPQRLAA